MALVHNWQLDRAMSYWYPESRPKKQFAAVFDTNKCIACQTCTLACKTTWTSGQGQEYMLWNNVESKPYGFYPLGWDVQLLERLGGQSWSGRHYEGRTIFEAAGAGERVLGWRPDELDYAYPNVGEDDSAGAELQTGAFMELPHTKWFFYLARICNHCTYPACLASCPRSSIYKRQEDGVVLIDQSRCRGYQECVRACPYKKTFFNPMTSTSEKCIGCFPKIEMGQQPQCFVNCIGKIRHVGWISRPEDARPDNPVDYLVHIRKVALPLYPQWGLEPNVYYIPPVHVPRSFLRMMFGPGVDHAIESYRKAPDDPDLVGLLSLFGSSPQIVPRWKRLGDSVIGLTEAGAEILRVPMKEPVHIRKAFDLAAGVTRTNTP
ncbi:MAG: dehydrogenase [Candidatus Eisenbacteria bacterium]|nr:dehydrogenase [Candidatus Eisenbacteria bacterium]